jgi:hypothetical protein
LDFAVTPVILVRQKQQSATWSVGSLQTIGMEKGIQREHLPMQMGSPALVLIIHFAAEIRLIAFLSHGFERPSSEF